MSGVWGDRELHVRKTIICVMNVRSANVTPPRVYTLILCSVVTGRKSSGRDGSENCRYVLKQAEEDEDVQQRPTEENNKQRD